MTTQNPVFKPADRLSGFESYYFAVLGKKITQLRKDGLDVIRLDMGSPDLPPAPFIVDTLVTSARRPDAHGYTPYGGTPAFKQACAVYYQRRFGVKLDPDHEVLALVGSKEGLFNLCQALVNPGDVVIVPDPGYPVYTAGAKIAGGEIYPLPLLEQNGFLPDLGSIPPEIARRAKILWLNYPNNPTGATATLAFFQKAVDFARQYEILLAHDAPYVDVAFDGYRPPSLLEVEGAKEVAVEFNSLSKAYNMGGWRLGMALGNPQVLGYLNTYKSQLDTSTFAPILKAGEAALTGDQTWVDARNKIYRQRRDIIWEALQKAGLKAQKPEATIYVWSHVPAGMTSTAFCDRLLLETGVSTTPGSVYGQVGEGFLRISLGIATERLQEAMERLVEWVKIKA